MGGAAAVSAAEERAPQEEALLKTAKLLVEQNLWEWHGVKRPSVGAT